MRALIQRVKKASVSIDGNVHNAISKGYLVLLGIELEDLSEDVEWLSKKISQMRVFQDEEGKMNLSLKDVGGQILLISQFTLHASTKKGNRPSFIKAARPELAIPLYKQMEKSLIQHGVEVKTGIFGAYMEIELINDGPVTIIIDSKQKE